MRKRSYKKFNEGKFLDEVSKIKWWPLYMSENVDEAVANLKSHNNPGQRRYGADKNFSVKTKLCKLAFRGDKGNDGGKR